MIGLAMLGLAGCDSAVVTTPPGHSNSLAIGVPTPLASATTVPLTTPTAPSSATPAAATPSPSPSPAPSIPTATPVPTPTPTPIPSAVPSAPNVFVDQSNRSDTNYGAYTVPFGAVGVPQALTFSPSYGTYTLTLDPATCGSGASAVVTVAVTGADGFSVTGQGAGLCKATVTSPSAVTLTMWFVVNVTGFTIQ
jgi:hypothetical protein